MSSSLSRDPRSSAVRIEIRVTSSSRSIDGVPLEPWAEIWSASLLPGESLSVTEAHLKLPLRRDPAAFLCSFTLVPEGLRFDRRSERFSAILRQRPANGEVCAVGDRVLFGNGFVFEVRRAPAPIPAAGVSRSPTSPSIGSPPIEIRRDSLETPASRPSGRSPTKNDGRPLFRIDSVPIETPTLGDDFLLGPRSTRRLPIVPPPAPAKRKQSRAPIGFWLLFGAFLALAIRIYVKIG